MKNNFYTILSLFYCILFSSLPLNAQVFVKWDATGANNGTSWANAYTDLQMALDSTFEEIWVAAGTYYPQSDTSGNYTPSDPRTKTFHDRAKFLRRVYGGFAGSENSLAERNFNNNHTIINGDIGTPSDTSDNVYHLYVINRQSGKSFDHISFINGNASGVGSAQMSGGAIYADSSFISFTHCEFRDNHAVLGGGAIFASQCYAYRLIDCVGINNFCYGNGGLSYSEFSEVLFDGSHFTSNTANRNGGAAYIGSQNVKGSTSSFYELTIVNCTLDNNYAADTGGAVYSPNVWLHTYSNCIFKLNESNFASSIYMNSDQPFFATSRIFNSTFAFNDNLGGNIIASGLSLVIRNSIFWQNNNEINVFGPNSNLDISHSIRQGGLTALDSFKMVLNKDPLFVAPPNDLNVSLASPAINGGTSSPAIPTSDILGQLRPQAGAWDIGPYEYMLPTTYEFNGPGDEWYYGTNWSTGFNPPNWYNGSILIHSNCIKPELPLHIESPGSVIVDDNVVFMIKTN